MFDNPVFVVILLVVVAALGVAAGFFAGRSKGQEMARDAKTADLNEAKAQIEADRQEISELSTAVTQYRTQAEGLAQQLTYLKSQLAQAQRAEQERVERERERAAAEAERKQAENERKLQEQSKVLSALAPVQKNLDALQQKVSQIEEGRKREMGALGEQLKGLGEQQARLDRETNALSSALRNNKVRGAWGEAQLRNIVNPRDCWNMWILTPRWSSPTWMGIRSVRIWSSICRAAKPFQSMPSSVCRLPEGVRDSRYRHARGADAKVGAAACACQGSA